MVTSYMNLLAGTRHFIADEPSIYDHLPVDDELWHMNVGIRFTSEKRISLTQAKIAPVQPTLSLLTPADVRVGPFARSVQAAHILRRVLTHCLKVTADELFNVDEAEQLNHTLMAFVALLPEQGCRPSPKYYCALGICTRYRLFEHPLNMPTLTKQHCENFSASIPYKFRLRPSKVL